MKKVVARVLIWLYLLAIMTPIINAETSTNWAGYGDTCTLPSLTGTATVYSTNSWSMTDYNGIRLVFMANDTSSAGFASDSIAVRWGYQSFCFCQNSAGAMDTCLSPRVVVDTMKTCSLGVMAVSTLDGNSIAKAIGMQSDTAFCTGFATQSRAVFPEWNMNYRLWAQGITGNKLGKPLKIKMANVRRVYAPTRGK